MSAVPVTPESFFEMVEAVRHAARNESIIEPFESHHSASSQGLARDEDITDRNNHDAWARVLTAAGLIASDPASEPTTAQTRNAHLQAAPASDSHVAAGDTR